jgi:HEAT repeat protein
VFRDRDSDRTAVALVSEVNGLVWQVSRGREEDRISAAQELARLAPRLRREPKSLLLAASVLSGPLVSGSDALAEVCALALGSLRESSTAADLGWVLSHRSGPVRAAAAWALGEIGSEVAATALRLALHEPDTWAAATRALTRMEGVGAVAGLVEALETAPETRDPELDRAISDAFVVSGALAATGLGRLLANPSDQVRRLAAEILVRMGATAAPELAGLLRSTEAHAREAAAEALGRIGRTAAPALAEALRHSESRPAAAELLLRLPPAVIIPPLIEALWDAEAGTRRQAVTLLQRLGWQPRTTAERVRWLLVLRQRHELERLDAGHLEPLVETLCHPDAELRSEAAQVIKAHGDAALPWVRGACSNHEARMRTEVARLLGEMQCPDRVPLLWSLLRDADEGVRSAAAESLDRIGTESIPALAATVTSGQDGEAVVAARALMAIAAREPSLAMREVLPALRARGRHRPFTPGGFAVVFRQAAAAIDRATAHLKDVPLPGARPAPDPEELPIPSESPPAERPGAPGGRLPFWKWR